MYLSEYLAILGMARVWVLRLAFGIMLCVGYLHFSVHSPWKGLPILFSIAFVLFTIVIGDFIILLGSMANCSARYTFHQVWWLYARGVTRKFALDSHRNTVRLEREARLLYRHPDLHINKKYIDEDIRYGVWIFVALILERVRTYDALVAEQKEMTLVPIRNQKREARLLVKQEKMLRQIFSSQQGEQKVLSPTLGRDRILLQPEVAEPKRKVKTRKTSAITTPTSTLAVEPVAQLETPLVLPTEFIWENEQGKIYYSFFFMERFETLTPRQKRVLTEAMNFLALQGSRYPSLKTKKVPWEDMVPHTPGNAFVSRGAQKIRFSWTKEPGKATIYYVFFKWEHSIRYNRSSHV